MGGIVKDEKMIFESCSLFCLAAALQAAASLERMQDVGSAFERRWQEGRTAGSPELAEEYDLISWGEGPKGNISACRNAANEQSRDRLGAEGISAASNAFANNSTGNNTTNETAIIPYP